MLQIRQGNALWRRLGPRFSVGTLGLVAVLFLIGCAQATPAPVPAANPVGSIVQPTAVPPTARPVTPNSQANDSGASFARVTGNFISGQQASISFQTPGRIKAYAVQEGDTVKAGDPLAELDTTLLDYQIAQAEAAVKLAQARMQQTLTPVSEESAAAAQAALKAAQANFVRVSKGPLPDELAAAKANLDRAKAALDQAQALYDRAGGATNPYSGLLPTSVGLQQATAGYDAALAQYNLAKDHPTAAELAGAASQLAQANAAVAQLTPTQENIAIAQAGVEQAQAAFDLARASAGNAKIGAPFAGTVIQLGPKAGEYANPGVPIVVLADLGQMQVQANVDELSLSGIKVGQRVTLFVDALGGQALTGRVSRIGLVAVSSGGVTSVPVTVDVDTAGAQVYPGLSATVQFEAEP